MVATRRACTPKPILRRKVIQMKTIINDLRKKALSVANTRVANYVKDVDLLTVALCAGNLNEIACTLYDAPNGDYAYIAAHKALDLGWNSALRKSMADAGYFSNGLCGLLDFCEQNPLAGTRLMPIFCEMISDRKKYGISRKLSARAKYYMSQKKSSDGFAITCLNDEAESVTVHAAPPFLG